MNGREQQLAAMGLPPTATAEQVSAAINGPRAAISVDPQERIVQAIERCAANTQSIKTLLVWVFVIAPMILGVLYVIENFFA